MLPPLRAAASLRGTGVCARSWAANAPGLFLILSPFRSCMVALLRRARSPSADAVRESRRSRPTSASWRRLRGPSQLLEVLLRVASHLNDRARADVLRDADPLAAAVLLEAVDEARVLLGGPAACVAVLCDGFARARPSACV